MAFQKVLAFKQALKWIQSLIIMKLTNNTEYYLMCFLNNKTMVDFDKLIVLHLILLEGSGQPEPISVTADSHEMMMIWNFDYWFACFITGAKAAKNSCNSTTQR